MTVLLLAIILKYVFRIRFPANTSIAGVTVRRYGQAILDTFRALERKSIKLDKCIADLKFLTVCRNADLIPVFLRFKLSSRRLSTSSETLRARRRLLTVELNAKEREINRLRGEVANEKSRLKDMVRRIDFVYYCNIVERTVQVNSVYYYNIVERTVQVNSVYYCNIVERTVQVNSVYYCNIVERTVQVNSVYYCNIVERTVQVNSVYYCNIVERTVQVNSVYYCNIVERTVQVNSVYYCNIVERTVQVNSVYYCNIVERTVQVNSV